MWAYGNKKKRLSGREVEGEDVCARKRVTIFLSRQSERKNNFRSSTSFSIYSSDHLREWKGNCQIYSTYSWEEWNIFIVPFNKMSSRDFAVRCVLAALGISFTIAWPSGAPEGACESLTPSHGSNRAKHYSTSPFTITQSYSDYQPGDKLKGKSLHWHSHTDTHILTHSHTHTLTPWHTVLLLNDVSTLWTSDGSRSTGHFFQRTDGSSCWREHQPADRFIWIRSWIEIDWLLFSCHSLGQSGEKIGNSCLECSTKRLLWTRRLQRNCCSALQWILDWITIWREPKSLNVLVTWHLSN